METDIKVQLNRIEKLTLLSAKNVLCLNDVVLAQSETLGDCVKILIFAS